MEGVLVGQFVGRECDGHKLGDTLEIETDGKFVGEYDGFTLGIAVDG